MIFINQKKKIGAHDVSRKQPYKTPCKLEEPNMQGERERATCVQVPENVGNRDHENTYEGISKSFRTEPITKNTLTTITSR
jgi:hypothetical protein